MQWHGEFCVLGGISQDPVYPCKARDESKVELADLNQSAKRGHGLLLFGARLSVICTPGDLIGLLDLPRLRNPNRRSRK